MLAACRGQTVDRPPVWLMRQAGRYLPEYLALSKAHGFWKLVRTPELAVEATLQPLKRFPLDAAILFCDILVVNDAMGAGVRYGQPGGPQMTRPFQGEEDLQRLEAVRVKRDLSYVADAMSLLRQETPQDKAVIGFAGAPLTLAAYLVEGGSSKDLRHLKALHYAQPALARRLLFGLADAVADLLRLQLDAGADLVQLFDSWAGLLSPQDYAELALPAAKRVFSRLQDVAAPKILYLRGAASHIEAAAGAGADVLSIDASISLAEARQRAPGLALQGNLDPAELLGPPDRIRHRVASMIDEAGSRGYIVNLGQGLVPDIPIEGVAAMVRAVADR